MSATPGSAALGLTAVMGTGLVILGAMLVTEAAATHASRLTVREALAYL